MVIDLLNLEPTKISRSLGSKYTLIYGEPKVGKTTFAASAPDNLILSFEKGLNFISGVYSVDIQKWSDFKLVLQQLRKPEVQAKYKTVTIDTYSIATELCEEHICNLEGITSIDKLEWGKGFTRAKQELDKCLRTITQLGYGLIIIAHAKKDGGDSKEKGSVERIVPDIPQRYQTLIFKLVDIIAYVDVQQDEQGNLVRRLITKGSPRVMAGTRIKYLAPVIEFSFKGLEEAVADAIEKSAQEQSGSVVDTYEVPTVKHASFPELQAESKQLWGQLAGDEKKMIILADRIVDICGESRRISTLTENEKDLLELIVEEMKQLAAN